MAELFETDLYIWGIYSFIRNFLTTYEYKYLKGLESLWDNCAHHMVKLFTKNY